MKNKNILFDLCWKILPNTYFSWYVRKKNLKPIVHKTRTFRIIMPYFLQFDAISWDLFSAQ